MSLHVVELTVGAVLAVASSMGVGFTGGWRAHQRRTVVRPDEQSTFVDETLDRDIEMAARQWAEANGRPEMAPLLADKVRVAWRARYGDGRDERR
jgi:hypothetical protein